MTRFSSQLWPIALSPLGIAGLLLLTIPNLLWAFRTRPSPPSPPSPENPILRGLERLGQILATFAAATLKPIPWTPANVGAVATAGLALILYELAWIHYFRSSRSTANLYRSFLKIPLPLASLPIVAFLLLGLASQDLRLLTAMLILGPGHLGIHIQHQRQLPG